jgi:hypothetical protein
MKDGGTNNATHNALAVAIGITITNGKGVEREIMQ